MDYDDHLLRASFLLQDCLTFIWSGTAVKLAHPKLFNRFKLRESVFIHGHLFLDPRLVQFPFNFSIVRCSLPVDEAEDEDADLDAEDDDLVFALPPRFIYDLFPNHAKDEEMMRDIVARVRLCLQPCSGIVIPQEKSIGGTIAANLVNGLFAALCNSAGMHTSAQQHQFVAALRGGLSATQNLIATSHPGCNVSLSVYNVAL